MKTLVGLLGYFGQNENQNLIDDFVSSENSECCTLNKISSSSFFLSALDLKGSAVKSCLKKANNISIVTYGEVYNDDFGNLSEEILELYKKKELHKIKNLNGYFIAAIHDSDEEKLTILNDRYGLIKLFYYHDYSSFYFSPKVKNLLFLNTDKLLQKDSMIDYFTIGYLPGDKTFFREIQQLPAGSILEYSKNELTITKYWNYEYSYNYDLRSKDELIDELGFLWQKAVEKRINKSEKILIPLSGGLDSRAILAAALKCTSKDNIITFTFGMPGSFDFEIGKLVARVAGVKNIELGVEKDNFESKYNISIKDSEGMIDATPYFALDGYTKMSKYSNKIYLGYMGDPIMGSHISLKMLNKKLNSDLDYSEVINFIFKSQCLYDFEEIKYLFDRSFFGDETINNSFGDSLNVLKKHSDMDMANFCALWDYVHRQNKYTMFSTFRYNENFVFITPFLDNDLIDFMLSISPQLRINTNLYKSMLLKKYPTLFTLPTKNNFGLGLDANKESILFRRIVLISKRKINKESSHFIKRNLFLDKNKNYIDYDDLLRTDEEYRNYTWNMLSKVKKRKYFNEEFIEKIWELHIKGTKNYSMLFGLLVTFELFLQTFFDE
ncbi:MAG: asparagine synthase-related protein [Methanosarcina sp.]